MMKQEQGFSFVEVLVAVVVLGLIIGGFSGVFSSSIGSILAAGDRYRAFAEAQELLERVLATDNLDGLEGVDWTEEVQIVDEVKVKGKLITVTVPAGRYGVAKLSTFKADPVVRESDAETG